MATKRPRTISPLAAGVCGRLFTPTPLVASQLVTAEAALQRQEILGIRATTGIEGLTFEVQLKDPKLTWEKLGAWCLARSAAKKEAADKQRLRDTVRQVTAYNESLGEEGKIPPIEPPKSVETLDEWFQCPDHAGFRSFLKELREERKKKKEEEKKAKAAPPRKGASSKSN